MPLAVCSSRKLTAVSFNPIQTGMALAPPTIFQQKPDSFYNNSKKFVDFTQFYWEMVKGSVFQNYVTR